MVTRARAPFMLVRVTSSASANTVQTLGLAPSFAAHLASFLDSPKGVAVLARYREPHRRYHNSTHLTELFGHMAEVAPQFRQLRPTLFAALYHDAIYDPRRKDNEARSAELACDELRDVLEPAELRVTSDLILATATHGETGEAVDTDVLLFLDCDAAILGAGPTRYRAYADGVRQEYGHVPKVLYRLGRGKFLRAMSKRAAIFRTLWFEDRYGEQAKLNLRAELHAL